MSQKNKEHMLKLLLITFIFFLIIYFTNETGYYEYKVYTKTKLTEESIIQFEEDIKNNKDVSSHTYVKEDYVDYSNKITKTGSKIGEFIEQIMNFIIKKSLKILSDLFYN